MKRLISALLAFVLVFTAFQAAFAKPFTDVPQTHWAYEYTDKMSDQGIINGYADGTFKPSGTITNAEFTAMLVTAYLDSAGLAPLEKAKTGEAWYKPAIDMARKLEISKGALMAGAENSPMARSDMALLISNVLGLKGVEAKSAAPRFTDAGEITKLNAAQSEAIAKVASVGIIKGDENKNFKPNANATRAEAAVMMSNLLNALPAAAPAVDSALKGAITIAAAASLKDAAIELEKLFNETYPNVKLTFTYGASGALQTQIEEGAPVDVFISAAQKQMDALDEKGYLLSGTRKDLLKNNLVLIVPADSKLAISSFEEAAGEKVKTIALGEPKSVPAGQYAEETFTSLKILDAVKAKANYGTDVRQVLTWVEMGEVDCGVVYSSDTVVGDVKIIAAAPSGSHKPIVYPAAVLKDGKSQDVSKIFVDFLGTASAMKIFDKYGFSPAN